MKKGWQKKRLGEVCEIIKGRKPTLKSEKSHGDLPYLVAKVMRGSAEPQYASVKDKNSVTVAKSEIIIICDGSNSGEVFTGFHGVLSSTMGKIAKKAEIDEGYLRAFLASTFELFNGSKTGTAIPHLDKEAMFRLEFPFPSLTEQRRIVGVLEEAFAGLGAMRENAEFNLSHARALFNSYIDDIFSKKGEGWVRDTIGNSFKLSSGENLTSKAMVNGPFSVFGGNGIAGMHNQFNLSGDNVIIGRVGALCGNVRNLKEKIWLTDNAFRVVDKRYQFDNEFLTYLLNFKNLRSVARQSAQPVISNSSLKDVVLDFPKHINAQKEISSNLRNISTEISRLEALYRQKLSSIDELKQSILRKAFAGELTAKEEIAA